MEREQEAKNNISFRASLTESIQALQIAIENEENSNQLLAKARAIVSEIENNCLQTKQIQQKASKKISIVMPSFAKPEIEIQPIKQEEVFKQTEQENQLTEEVEVEDRPEVQAENILEISNPEEKSEEKEIESNSDVLETEPKIEIPEEASLPEKTENNNKIESAIDHIMPWETIPSDEIPTYSEPDNMQKSAMRLSTINELKNKEHTINENWQSASDSNAEMKPIKELKSAISINDKFNFIKELFHDDQNWYQQTIKTLDNFKSRAEAEFYWKRELETKLGRDTNSATYQKFLQLFHRRFS